MNGLSEFDSEWRPNVLVLGPGGVKGFLELGALLQFEKKGYFENIEYYTGCSAGAAIVLLIVAGYKISEILQICWNINVLNDITDLDIKDIKEKTGLISNKTVETLLTNKIIEKFGKVLTLKQLYYATGKIINIVTYNLDDDQTEYFNKDTEPNISCIHAVMMSMAIPLLMQSRRYKGRDYIDGAIGNPYPIDIHDDGINQILGIYISSSKGNNSGILKKAYKMLHASMGQIRNRIINTSSKQCKHLELNSNIMDATGITVPIELKKEMIRSGYQEANKFIEKIQNPNKYRILLSDDEEIPIASSDELFRTPNLSSPYHTQSILDHETNSVINMLINNQHVPSNNNNNNNNINNNINNNNNDNNKTKNILMIPITKNMENKLKAMKYRNNRII